MTGLIDPVGVGLIASLARPGNNTTGISNMIQDMSAKGLELIREVAPTAKTIAALFNPNNPGSRLILEDVRSQAAKLGMTIQPIEFKGSAVLDATLEAAAGRDALLVVAEFCAPRPWRTHRRAGTTTSAADILLNSRVHRRRRVGWLRPLQTGQLPTCRDLREEVLEDKASRHSGRTADADRVVDQYADREGARHCYSGCLARNVNAHGARAIAGNAGDWGSSARRRAL